MSLHIRLIINKQLFKINNIIMMKHYLRLYMKENSNHFKYNK
jgi:hypothetical protein